VIGFTTTVDRLAASPIVAACGLALCRAPSITMPNSVVVDPHDHHRAFVAAGRRAAEPEEFVEEHDRQEAAAETDHRSAIEPLDPRSAAVGPAAAPTRGQPPVAEPAAGRRNAR